MRDRPRWMRWDIDAWYASANVQAMSLEERGAYHDLIMRCFGDGSVPDPPLRELRITAEVWGRLWPVLEPCFVRHDGRLFQRRAQKEYRSWKKLKRSYIERGRLGGLAKPTLSNLNNGGQLASSNSQAIAKQQPSNSLAAASGSQVRDVTVRDVTVRTVRKKTKDRTEDKDSAFAEFWSAYPKKVGKDKALQAWQKRRPNAELVATILEALRWQSQQEGWLKDGGQFVPHPATWLNQGRWQDEPPDPLAAYSDTTRYNLTATQEAERMIVAIDAQRTGKHGHRR